MTEASARLFVLPDRKLERRARRGEKRGSMKDLKRNARFGLLLRLPLIFIERTEH